jgi:uncharacterized membrane protein YbhN (UPF0104 family)
MQESQNLHEPIEGESRRGVAPLYVKILRWILTAICMVWVVWYFYNHRQSLYLFTSLSALVEGVLLILAAVHMCLYALQFYLVLRTCTPRPFSFFAFFKTIILGRIFSNIAPQGGNVYRAVYFKYKFGISYTHYLGGFLCFLWIDAAMNILLAAAVFGWFEPGFCIGPVSIWWVLLALTAMWFTPVLFEALFRRYSFGSGGLLRLHGRISEMLTIAVQSLSHIRMLGMVTAANALNFVNTMLFFYLCLSGFGNAVEVPVLMVFFVLMKITSYMIITPGNFGLREIAYAFLGRQMGMDAGQAVVLSILHRLAVLIIVVLLAACFGGYSLLRRGKTDRRFKQSAGLKNGD